MERKCWIFAILSSLLKAVRSCSSMKIDELSLCVSPHPREFPISWEAKSKRCLRFSDFQLSITRFKMKFVTGTDKYSNLFPVAGHVLFPWSIHSLIAACSKVWPVSKVTGSSNNFPVRGQIKSFGMFEKKDPSSKPLQFPCSSVMKESWIIQMRGKFNSSKATQF